MKYYVTSKISDNIQETPEGFLVCIGVPIARTGEMLYAKGEIPVEADEEGKIVIERKPEEVFRPETMASFEGKAVTLKHPSEFVSPENWGRLAKGVMQNVRRGSGEFENDLLADLLITDSVAINLVKNGLREVSCGYEAEYTQTGEGRGMQSNIVGNHLALVEAGRAGSSYAINDHKGVIMKLSEKIKSIFAKAQDEAMKLAETTDADMEKKDDDKDKKSKDAMSSSHDELVKMVKDLGDKISAMAPKAADATSPASENEPAKTVAKDDQTPVAPEGGASVEDRLKVLEAFMAKALSGSSEDEEEEESMDGEEESGEESEDEEKEDKGSMVGDAASEIASRAEILSPGIKASKDMKVKALKAAYDTKEGKKIIDSLTGGKPTFDSAEKVETLFIAASELLKVSRNSEFSKTKQTRDYDSGNGNSASKAFTPDQMNEINAKHYSQK